uniref:Uncharacterized protein n=1 Tax=Bursaphelenchus xylophilus TaxID=6326 RepID=A0A1I7SR83_BURXY
MEPSSIEATPENIVSLLLSGAPLLDGPFLAPGLGMPRVVLEFEVPPYMAANSAPSCHGEPIPVPLTCKPLSWFFPTPSFLVLEARPCMPIVNDQVGGSYLSAERESTWTSVDGDQNRKFFESRTGTLTKFHFLQHGGPATFLPEAHEAQVAVFRQAVLAPLENQRK